ncbi:hypothetical protein HYC85_031336 [Camellia sinensis]|uniref:Uncharacterized protein n=1 Tax=Camellia sinensis TaxID=4442 RepID=A0A7J7FQB8_CAMSI|nr:hypothetical protein HYC85_031336 [Camellia sinensis]
MDVGWFIVSESLSLCPTGRPRLYWVIAKLIGQSKILLKCLKFKTDQAQEAKKMEKFNNIFFTLMARGPEGILLSVISYENLILNFFLMVIEPISPSARMASCHFKENHPSVVENGTAWFYEIC